MLKEKKGFTILELVIVVAIVALIFAIVLPSISSATVRTRAATDASILRSMIGEANVIVFSGSGDPEEAICQLCQQNVKCASYPDAQIQVLYTVPGFVDAYFVQDGCFYGLKYFGEVASTGSSNEPTTKPIINCTHMWLP